MLKLVIVIMAARATFHHQESKQGVERCACNHYVRQGKRRRPFAVFVGTYRYVLDPQFVDINVKIDCRKSSFSIPSVMDVQLESLKNPVTGEEQDTKIQLSTGFIWKLGDAAKSKMMCITTPNLNFNDAGKNAFYSVVEYNGP
jgi:hypothetical protein